MIIKPKIRGFICTTTHPVGCEQNIKDQITVTRTQGQISNGPKRVLVIGSSTGYGLASRITAAFGCRAATIAVFFEKPATEKKIGTAGWYNSAAFDRLAHEEGLYAKSLNGDAFSYAAKDKIINLIKNDLDQVDMVIYSLAAPFRKLPDSGKVIRSVLKPIGKRYRATAVNINTDTLFEASIEPATQKEIADTVTVMGGEDWKLWIKALSKARVLAEGCKTVSYSYIGPKITWPIYWEGTLGEAKKDLDRAAHAIDEKMKKINGSANIVVLKSVVTQASSAIPIMPLYIAIVFNKMREEGIYEGCIEQINRMFRKYLYRENGAAIAVDHQNRIRLDNLELRNDIQAHCQELWTRLNNDNLVQLTDYNKYKKYFLQLFGFSVANVDYTADVNFLVPSNIINI